MFRKQKVQNSSRLGDLLLEKRLINRTQLEQALSYQKSNQLKLGESLMKLGFIHKNQLDTALCRQSAMRSLCAGLIFIASPWCQVMASEKYKPLESDLSNWNSISSNSTKHANSSQSKYGNYILGIQYQKSFHWGIELSMTQDVIHINGDEVNQWVPQITLFGSQNQTSDSYWPKSSAQSISPRFDRYKNTSPAIYRLTLRGYSLIETTENQSRYFAFNRHKGHSFKNYDLMFSITKHFE